jgi:hypothetical protein
MTNVILFFVHLIFVLTFVDLINTAASPIDKKETGQSNFTNHSHSICFNNMTCNKNKRCVNMNICICEQGWTTYGDTVEINNSCSYKQYSKTTALLVSVYFGVLGIDWFYLSRGNSRYIVTGIFKLLIACGCVGGWPLLMFGRYRLSDVMIAIGHLVSILFSLISLIWWITDWARILANKFPDGNGIELKHFSDYF